MNKSTAIQKFTEGCANPANFTMRRHSVKYQCNRNLWQVNHIDGIVRIERDPTRGTAAIKFWPPINSGDPRMVSAELSEQEYKNLEHLFKGNYKPDIAYLRRYNPELWPKKKGFTLIWLPIGAGFVTLLLIGLGEKKMKFQIGLFIATVVIWLGHELYKKLKK